VVAAAVVEVDLLAVALVVEEEEEADLLADLPLEDVTREVHLAEEGIY